MPPQDGGSILLDRSDSITTTTTSSSSLRSLSSFLRRHLLCGSSWKPPPRRPLPLPLPPESPPPPKSDKLLHLLHLAEIHERQEIDQDTRRKVDSLERLKDVVRDLQCLDDDEPRKQKKKEGAVRVRLLSKEDGEARVMLAMLGAIPPLVGMLDCDDDDDQAKINALYALLNLGIGNDA